MFDRGENWDWKWETSPRTVTWAKWVIGFPKRKKDDCVELVGGGFVDTVCTDLKNGYLPERKRQYVSFLLVIIFTKGQEKIEGFIICECLGNMRNVALHCYFEQSG